MAVNFPPYYTSQILNADGKPVAGGTIRAYFTGTESPAPLFTSDGTPLGSSVSIDAAGNSVFCLRVGTTYRLRCIDAAGAVVWTRDGVRALGETAGIENPMTDYGDLIVGGAAGEPVRLALGNVGQMLTPSTFGQPHLEWVDIPTQPGDHKVYADSMDTSAGALTQKLKAGTNVTLTLNTSGGTRKVEISAATQTGDHKVSTDGTDTAGYLEDKVTAGAGISVTKSSGQLVVAATGADTNEVKTSASDDHPGYLQSKVLAGDLIKVEKEQTPDGDGGYTENLRVGLDARGVSAGYVPIADGSNSSAWAAIPTQTGDRKSLVTAADTSAGYLADKLVAGTNVTLTTTTDLDGVQTLEISAAGGGGGGSDWDIVPPIKNRYYNVGSLYAAIAHVIRPLGDTIRSLAFGLGYSSNTYRPGVAVAGEIAIYSGAPNNPPFANALTRIAHKSFSQTIVSPIVWASFDADVDVSDKTKQYVAAISINRPVDGYTLGLMLDDEWTQGSVAYLARMWGSSSHISLNSTMTFNQGLAENYLFWLGVSSRNLG